MAASRLALGASAAVRGDASLARPRSTASRRVAVRGRAAPPRAAVTDPPASSVAAPAPRTTDQIYTDALAPGVDVVRCVCKERLKFEVEYGMQRGSTDNSYVVRGSDAVALLDLPDKSFASAFASATDCAAFDFVVLGHLSPKRLDALAAVLDARPADAPAVEVCCSNPAAQIIYAALKPGTPASNDALAKAWKREGSGLRARLRILRSGDALDLGGRELAFTLAPTPRWPDTVVTHDATSGILFTSKLFSAHVATDEGAPTDAGAGFDAFGADWRYFFDCMLAPMARPAKSALVKLEPFVGAAGAEGVPRVLPPPTRLPSPSRPSSRSS